MFSKILFSLPSPFSLSAHQYQYQHVARTKNSAQCLICPICSGLLLAHLLHLRLQQQVEVQELKKHPLVAIKRKSVCINYYNNIIHLLSGSLKKSSGFPKFILLFCFLFWAV